MQLIAELPFMTLILAALVAMMAGVIKGAIGFAMPLVMISGIGSLVDPKIALASLILPIVLSNGMQTFRAGISAAIAAARQFWRYLLMVCLAIFLAAQTVPYIPNQTFYLVLGIPVVLLAAVQLLGVRLRIPEAQRVVSEWIVGTVSGVLGGIAGTWGPMTVLYLLAIDTPKTKQIVVQGVIYGLGAISLLVAHIHSGILNAETAPLSAAMVPPAMVGMWIGFKINDRLDQELFRKITLIVLIVAGLNLVRRGLFG